MPTLATNKRARFDYELLEEYEAGLKLTGAEVKSIKGGHAQIDRAFVSIEQNAAWLKGAHVSAYKPAGVRATYDPERPRKLLLHKREIQRMIGKGKEAGLTFVPISIYTKGDLVKLSFALAKGKRKYEKREAIKSREFKRERERITKE